MASDNPNKVDPNPKHYIVQIEHAIRSLYPEVTNFEVVIARIQILQPSLRASELCGMVIQDRGRIVLLEGKPAIDVTVALHNLLDRTYKLLKANNPGARYIVGDHKDMMKHPSNNIWQDSIPQPGQNGLQITNTSDRNWPVEPSKNKKQHERQQQKKKKECKQLPETVPQDVLQYRADSSHAKMLRKQARAMKAQNKLQAAKAKEANHLQAVERLTSSVKQMKASRPQKNDEMLKVLMSDLEKVMKRASISASLRKSAEESLKFHQRHYRKQNKRAKANKKLLAGQPYIPYVKTKAGAARLAYGKFKRHMGGRQSQ